MGTPRMRYCNNCCGRARLPYNTDIHPLQIRIPYVVRCEELCPDAVAIWCLGVSGDVCGKSVGVLDRWLAVGLYQPRAVITGVKEKDFALAEPETKDVREVPPCVRLRCLWRHIMRRNTLSSA